MEYIISHPNPIAGFGLGVPLSDGRTLIFFFSPDVLLGEFFCKCSRYFYQKGLTLGNVLGKNICLLILAVNCILRKGAREFIEPEFFLWQMF